MQVIGLPASTPVGSTVCVTVTGAAGPLKAVATGSVAQSSVVVTQSSTDPLTWTVCFKVGRGAGSVYLSGSGPADYKTVGVCGL